MPRRIDILMYHSISDGPGPTNIAPDVFAAQIDALAESGLPVVTLDDLVALRAGERELPERSVIITFDDGFQDFAETAWPILKARDMTAINYLPVQYLGGWAEFDPDGGERGVMSMETARDLQADGAHFGSHTVSHADLTALDENDLADELTRSRDILQDGLGRAIRHIAPPYGAVSKTVNAAIAEHYDTSVTTQLAFAGDADPLTALPRIEMFYFTDPAHWQGYLNGRSGYLHLRRALRAVGMLRYLRR